MARTTLTRTITTSNIYASTVVIENGEVEVVNLPRVKTTGKVNNDEAIKLVKKAYGKNGAYVIREIEVFEQLYEISLEDFLKYATPIENR